MSTPRGLDWSRAVGVLTCRVHAGGPPLPARRPLHAGRRRRCGSGVATRGEIALHGVASSAASYTVPAAIAGPRARATVRPDRVLP